MGAKVALLERDGDASALVTGDIQRSGGTALAVPCHVSQDASVTQAALRVQQQLGRVSCYFL